MALEAPWPSPPVSRHDPLLLKGFRAVAGDASRAAFAPLRGSRVRNGDYDVLRLQEEIQGALERGRRGVGRARLPGTPAAVRARVRRETRELLEEMSREVARLAREASNVREFEAGLGGLSRQIEDWAGGRGAAEDTGNLAERARLAPTEDNIEGPFYRPDAPFTTRLAGPQEAGDVLVVSGRVLGADGEPLPGALVDVWLADSRGAYDIAHPSDRDNPDIPYRLRGRMRAGPDGAFRYEAVLPGQYEIAERDGLPHRPPPQEPGPRCGRDAGGRSG